MNNREHLLADTFDDNNAGAAFARAAAAHARRRRALRQAGVTASLALAAVALFVFTHRSVPSPAIATVPAARVTSAPAYETISDQELLAQLKDQPVLLLKDHTGITGVVYLADQSSRSSL